MKHTINIANNHIPSFAPKQDFVWDMYEGIGAGVL